MTVRAPWDNELEDVYRLLFHIPALDEMPTFDRMKECIAAGRFPKMRVAVDKGEVVGMAMFSISYSFTGDGEVFLYAVSVKPERRRQGVGTALIKAVQQEAFKVNAPMILLIVHNENADAFSFYRTFGFSEAGGEFKQIAIPVEI